MIYSLQHEVFLASCYRAISFMNVCSNGNLYATKLWHSNWNAGLWMPQDFKWCNNKSSSTKSIYDEWNHIHNYSLPYHLLFTVSEIPYCMCLSVKYYWISYGITYSLVLTVLTVTILFIVNLILIVLDIF